VSVITGTIFKRRAEFRGRAFQLGCVPARPSSDGVVHERAQSRWTWYRHTEDLRLARG
jgi:hypothetical protein